MKSSFGQIVDQGTIVEKNGVTIIYKAIRDPKNRSAGNNIDCNDWSYHIIAINKNAKYVNLDCTINLKLNDNSSKCSTFKGGKDMINTFRALSVIKGGATQEVVTPITVTASAATTVLPNKPVVIKGPVIGIYK